MKTSGKFNGNGCIPMNMNMIQFWYSWGCKFVSKPIEISSIGKLFCYTKHESILFGNVETHFLPYLSYFPLIGWPNSMQFWRNNSEDCAQTCRVHSLWDCRSTDGHTLLNHYSFLVSDFFISFWPFNSTRNLIPRNPNSIYSSISLSIYAANLMGASAWENMNRHGGGSSKMRVK